MRAFAAAARDFYEAAPWQHLSDEDLIHVEAPAVASGQTFGLGFFATAKEFEAVQESPEPEMLLSHCEFDARGGWNTGFRSCAAWLGWRVGLDLGAARERVRVARALGTLPLLAQALARGELSYAKVRALTRVASPETEARLLAVGR